MTIYISDNLIWAFSYTPVLIIRLKTVLIQNLGVLYASVALDSELGFVLLEQAVKSLLQVVDMQPTPTILWSIRYKQHSGAAHHLQSSSVSERSSASGQILEFSPPSSDLAFDDSMLGEVKELWLKILGDEAGEFMVFEDREGIGPDIDDDE